MEEENEIKGEEYNIVTMEEMEKLKNRFVLKKSEKTPNRWQIFDKEYNVLYSFLENDYYNTFETCYLNDEQENMDMQDKLHLRYDMEQWFLMYHDDLACPDQEFTMQWLEGKDGNYYKITHHEPMVFELYVKDEGAMKELAANLRRLADYCDAKDLIIM